MSRQLQHIAERAKRRGDRPLDSDLPELIERYEKLRHLNARPHDPFIHICIEQAFLAANSGSFAVGSVIIDRRGRVLQRSAARVLQPHLRTDLHAEMHALTKLEERRCFTSRDQLREALGGSTLFSSLEPCPMCFTRWILSGVTNVFYAAAEPLSGMVEVAERMPTIWTQIIHDGGKAFGAADCSPKLAAFCLELFVRSQRAGGGPKWQWK